MIPQYVFALLNNAEYARICVIYLILSVSGALYSIRLLYKLLGSDQDESVCRTTLNV